MNAADVPAELSHAFEAQRTSFDAAPFLLDGKMFCGIVKEDLMVRVGPERYEAALADGVNPWDLGTVRCCAQLKTRALLEALR